MGGLRIAMSSDSVPSQESMFSALRDEFEYYLAHQGELVDDYDGRVIVLKNHQVLEEYDSEGVAYIETKKTHEPGTFLIQRVSPGTEAYTSTYHSRVVFG